MLFNAGSLLSDTCFIRFGVYHFQQIQCIVDTSGGEALDLLGFLAGLFRALGVGNASIGKGTRPSGLGVLLFIATLFGRGFLGWHIGFLLGEETGGFSLTGQLLLALRFLVGILILLSTIVPLGCLLAFL